MTIVDQRTDIRYRERIVGHIQIECVPRTAHDVSHQITGIGSQHDQHQEGSVVRYSQNVAFHAEAAYR